MILLATVEQTREFLNFDADLPDQNLHMALLGASAAILNYLRLDEDAYANSDGTMELDTSTGGYAEVPANVQIATMILAGMLMRDPDGVESQKWQHGFLPFNVTSLIYSLRDPALA